MKGGVRLDKFDQHHSKQDIIKQEKMKQLNIELERMHEELTRINQELQKWKYYAQRDDMTELLNKREGMQLLAREIEIIKATNKPLAICFIDIDDLKKINDELGHVEGDHLILDTATIIKDNIRKYDIAFRFGGDEFIIIFPDTTHDAAVEVLQRIDTKIQEFNSHVDKYNIQISFGIYEYPVGEEISVDTYIELADQKMYLNKKNKSD